MTLANHSRPWWSFVVFCVIINTLEQTNSQLIFLRDCNHPTILAHMVNMGATGFLHSFCYHSCGYNLFGPTPGSLEQCTPAGMCLCQSVCDNPPPVNRFGDQCPPYPGIDPPDPDPNYEAQCQQQCLATCPDGQSMVCGETAMTGLGPGVNEWAKICTCYCPPQPCVPPTPPTTIAPPTTTTIPTTTTTSTAIAIIPIKKPKILKPKKLLLKFLILCILIIKLCFKIYFLKLLAFYIYYFMDTKSILGKLLNAL